MLEFDLDVISLLQVISIPVSIYIAFTKKRNVYIATFLFNILNLFVYALRLDVLSVLSYCLICTRSFVYLFKDKLDNRYIPVIFVGLHVLLGTLSLSHPLQVLAIVAPCLTCTYMWLAKNEQQLRVGNMVTNGVWLVYNLLCGLYGLSVTRIVTIAANSFSYIKHKKKC